MDIKQYIESGVLEEYCLGHLNEEDQSFLIQMAMLYPEVKAELDAVELAMETLTTRAAIEPAAPVKNKILAALGFSAETLDINQLPALDDNSDLDVWLDTLSHLIPADPQEDFIFHSLRDDKQYQQTLIVTKHNVPEEEHGEFLESFFILKGQCECTVGNDIFRLSEGDFLEIPLHVKHDIKMLTPYVVGILQYQFV